jgi:hypothetical protein
MYPVVLGTGGVRGLSAHKQSCITTTSEGGLSITKPCGPQWPSLAHALSGIVYRQASRVCVCVCVHACMFVCVLMVGHNLRSLYRIQAASYLMVCQ